MTKEELKQGLDNLEKAKKRLLLDYIASINPVKVGDIIEDHYHTIRVESWEYKVPDSGNIAYLSIAYKGTRLTKKGTEAKVGADDNTIYLLNIWRINGKCYKFIP